IQADLKTFAAFGVYGASVVTALTAQNTGGVHAIAAVEASFVAAQIDAVLDDLDVGTAKTGMLLSAAVIDAVADRLATRPLPHLVVDPVLVATTGEALLEPAGTARLRERPVPLAPLPTPNLREPHAPTRPPAANPAVRTGPGSRRSSGKRTERGDGRPSSPVLELLQPSRPVLLQQARERAVGEERPARLAAGTVVRLVPRVDDPLHGRAADRTRLPVAAVDGHGRTEGGDALRKPGPDFVPQALRPLTERRTDRVVQPSDLLITQLTRALHR